LRNLDITKRSSLETAEWKLRTAKEKNKIIIIIIIIIEQSARLWEGRKDGRSQTLNFNQPSTHYGAGIAETV
jgi:predicted Fe-S protein YdhL (DUF1289 family)